MRENTGLPGAPFTGYKRAPWGRGLQLTHRVEIHYCTGCRWLLRAAWMAQELLTTFEEEIDELTLRPGIGGVFDVRVNGELIWSRRSAGRFPDIAELKRAVRDRVAPDKGLGHADRGAEDPSG